MNDIQRIKILETSSPHLRIYGISKKLANCTMNIRAQSTDPAVYTAGIHCITSESAVAASRLYLLPGISGLSVGPYEIHISIATACDWAEVNDQIIEILREVYFSGQDVEMTEGKVGC